MINDPYSVLGVSRNATPEEIKKAYRQMARKYHPDMHPDDPDAAKKMNEINEAYDMLTNPEKYEKERAKQQAYQQYRQQSQNGYYGSSGQGSQGQSSGGYGYGNNYSHYDGQYGWSGNFYDFFSNFSGYTGGSASINPQPQAGDSNEVRTAINYINTGKYQAALSVLGSITSQGRNARWYYLCSLAYYGGGDMTHATDYMQKACQMDSNNQTYKQLLMRFMQNSRAQSESTSSYTTVRRVSFLRILLPMIIMFLLYSFMFRSCFGCMGTRGFYNNAYTTQQETSSSNQNSQNSGYSNNRNYGYYGYPYMYGCIGKSYEEVDKE